MGCLSEANELQPGLVPANCFLPTTHNVTVHCEADRGRLARQRREFKIHRKSTAQLLTKHMLYLLKYRVSYHVSHKDWVDLITKGALAGGC